MRVTTYIPVNQIIIDRYPINPATLELVDHLRKGGGVQPIHVQPTGMGAYKIRDGRHRVTAYRLLGKETILAYVGISEAPNPDKELIVAGEGHVPQADGCSLDISDVPKE